MYDVYEIGMDGPGMTNLTNRSASEDTEPCHLPDGIIAFTSSRAGRLVQCGDWALACGLYSMNRDGSDVRQITEPKEGEFYPSVPKDARIMYTRPTSEAEEETENDSPHGHGVVSGSGPLYFSRYFSQATAMNH